MSILSLCFFNVSITLQTFVLIYVLSFSVIIFIFLFCKSSFIFWISFIIHSSSALSLSTRILHLSCRLIFHTFLLGLLCGLLILGANFAILHHFRSINLLVRPFVIWMSGASLHFKTDRHCKPFVVVMVSLRSQPLPHGSSIDCILAVMMQKAFAAPIRTLTHRMVGVKRNQIIEAA